MSAFNEIFGTCIEVRRRALSPVLTNELTVSSNSIANTGDYWQYCTKTSKEPSIGEDIFPEFTNLLEVTEPGDDDSQGCPLPGTPENESQIDANEEEEELRRRVLNPAPILEVGMDRDDLDLSSMAHSAFETAEELVHKVWEEVSSWKVQHFSKLPRWLQDNDFLHNWHRPPLPSFSACFRSIFRIHTETGNIWTHLLGCVAFIGVMVYFLLGSNTVMHLDLQEKIVFVAFFIAAIVCLGLSFTFHTVSCHSEFVGKLFGKLDYCGIALLIMGSFVPWLYYGFYCDFQPKFIYLTAVVLLGVSTIVVSMSEKFSIPKYRYLRAGVFVTFGLSGIIPAVHYALNEGSDFDLTKTSLGWLMLMGGLYILGAVVYAVRVPERFFPGKCDLCFQSHQIFHVLVIAAAFVHYHGISEMAMYRLTHARCAASEIFAHARHDIL